VSQKQCSLQGGYLLWWGNKYFFQVSVKLVDEDYQTLVYGCLPIYSLAHTALVPGACEGVNSYLAIRGEGAEDTSFKLFTSCAHYTSSGSLAKCLCKDHIQRLWFGSTTEFLIERENLWYEMVLKASHASTKDQSYHCKAGALWYECALTRLIKVKTTINCGWDNKIYYCGRTFHASADILMKLLCWLAARQEENEKQSTRCRLDEDTPSSLTLLYQMKATNKWLYTCKYVLFLYSANSCDDNQLRSIICSCFAHSAKMTVSCC
jgi:hypothetical protein